MIRARRTCFLLAFLKLCFAQSVVSIQPSRVVDIRTLIRARTGRSDFLVLSIAQNHRRWAAVVNFNDAQESRVVTGTDVGDPNVSDAIDGVVERVALDSAGSVYLRMRARSRGFTEIEVRNNELQLSTRYKFNSAAHLEPVLASSGVYWIEGNIGTRIFGTPLRIRSGKLQSVDKSASPSTTVGSDTSSVVPEFSEVFGIQTGSEAPRWLRLSEIAERVEIFENNRKVQSNSFLDVDRCYTAAKLPIAKRNPSAGADRMTWAGLSHEGDLFVCLSSVPIGAPRPIGIFNPTTGELLKLLTVNLPQSLERRDEYNPQGHMHPVKGAVGDRLAILDTQVGLLAIYSNY